MSINFQHKHVLPTPAGAFYCTASVETDPAKLLLKQLMEEKESKLFDDELLAINLPADIKERDEIIFHMQKLKWLQGFDQTQHVISGTIEEAFPAILGELSSDGKALLADDQGLYLTGMGFTHEASEELSALSADLSSLYARHHGIVNKNLNVKSSAFALVDAAGYSQLGFWPLNIGEMQFMLVVSGAPRFDQHAFVKLIWSLHQRYYISETSFDLDVA